MTTAPPRPSWLAVWLAWTAVALAFLPQLLLLNADRTDPWPTAFALARSLAIFGTWAVFTPFALRAVERWPPFGARRVRNVLRLVALALLLSVLHLVAMTVMTTLAADGPVNHWRLFVALGTGLGATNLLLAGAVYAVGIARLQSAARRRAEQQLGEVRLAALRHQLQPHFLFNALNAMAELVHADPLRAEALLLQLSALLRRALDGGDARRITLREELDFLDDYLAIQQSLFGDRLRIGRDIDARALDATLPPMLLQPLVENALRHGLGPRREGGVLRLHAARDGATLRLVIADDGVGATLPVREGLGLRITRERLATEYGDAAGMYIDAGAGDGFGVRLELPWRAA